MKLKKYLSDRRVDRGELAVRLHVSRAYLSHLCSGFRRASVDLCLRLERETGGLVRCEDLRPDVDWAYLRGSSPTPNQEAA